MGFQTSNAEKDRLHAMLTFLAATLPPRVGHFLARLLGISAAAALFCPCCSESLDELW